MPDKPCRSCGSQERYSKEVHAAGGYGPNLLPVGWAGFGGPRFEIRVCGNCGLVDWFVPQDLLPKVKKKFARME